MQELALALNDPLDSIVAPDMGVVGGALPIGVDIQDLPRIIAKPLCEDAIHHLAAPVVLLDNPRRKILRSAVKIYHDAVHTKGISRNMFNSHWAVSAISWSVGMTMN